MTRKSSKRAARSIIVSPDVCFVSPMVLQENFACISRDATKAVLTIDTKLWKADPRGRDIHKVKQTFRSTSSSSDESVMSLSSPLSGSLSPTSSDSQGSTDRLDLMVDALCVSMTQPTASNGVDLQVQLQLQQQQQQQQQQRILESKQRASRKKNQKRREAAKRKALLLAGSTMTASSDLTPPAPMSSSDDMTPEADPKIESEPVKEGALSPFSEPSSPSLVSESTFSTSNSVEPTTPALPQERSSDNDTPLAEESIAEDTAALNIEDDQDGSINESDEAQAQSSSDSATVATPTTEDLDVADAIDSPDTLQEGGDRQNENASPPESTPIGISSWDMASESVATVALQCLSKDKDMELSYVAILSAMTVLQTDQEQPSTLDEHTVTLSDEAIESKRRVAGYFSQILSLMCVPATVEGLGKEIQQQGVMAPESLYSQFYGSIQQAGYELDDQAHLSMAQYWMNRKSFEDAQECLHRIDTTRWSDVAYRTAIRCLLMSKPRQLHDAESTLSQWISSQDGSESSQNTCKEWFQLQLDASKWEDVKALYERKRSRLLDAPSNDRVADAESRLTPQALQDHQQHEQSMSPSRNQKHQRSVSITSSTTTSSHRRSPTNQLSSISGHQRSPSGHQRTPSTAKAWPSGASASAASTAPAAPTPSATKGTFSFLSSLKFGAKTGEAGSPGLGTTTALPSRLNVNRHLTVLDNSMLEDCIAHKQFEYGWKNIYERMGPTLEDGDTARIAMRLCRRAFLGHSGLSFDQPGSPNLIAKDMYFDTTDSCGADSGSKASDSDPALWEGRAWVIYNKAMLNPHAFLSKSTGVSSHHPLALQGNVAGAGSTPMAMFWHDILTISIHSPEVSSRYLKSFKIYVAMRSDPAHHQQLRDPFVMSCMLKAVYDAALAIVHNADQPPSPIPTDQSIEALKRHRRTSSLSLNRKQPITLGPVIDLAFEIYADLRQVGPIRHLPSLITLAPTSPAGVSQAGSDSSPRVSASVELSKASSSDVPRNSSISISSRSSFNEQSMPVFQDLNPTLKPNPQAKSLPPHIYLALLHLSIQVPVFRLSSLVVGTIVSDLQSEAGVKLTRRDHHLAAALQCYHDTWMCAQIVTAETKTSDASAQTTPCAYFEWMYQPLDSNEEVSDQGVIAGGPLEPSLEPSPSTCNDNIYWDLWSSSDPALQELRFTPERAEKLWDHVAQALL
ncbi:hypothetical protein EMPS_06707 [Entomortierella parvispora]|uniref:Uncharacterized protein n=1 Tax=Entomortierella parvispora TaxID=205924 RepID=A0A9P3LXP2_9FUNG|nr:hypothetical protein EMPS_06707 [Entomortierella parvispora]